MECCEWRASRRNRQLAERLEEPKWEKAAKSGVDYQDPTNYAVN